MCRSFCVRACVSQACTSSTDPAVPPPGLYGVWTTSDNPGWNGDYTVNRVCQRREGCGRLWGFVVCSALWRVKVLRVVIFCSLWELCSWTTTMRARTLGCSPPITRHSLLDTLARCWRGLPLALHWYGNSSLSMSDSTTGNALSNQ